MPRLNGASCFQDGVAQHRLRGAGAERAAGGHLRLPRRGHRRVLPRAAAGGRLPPPAQGRRPEPRDGGHQSLDKVSYFIFI